jgi:hypothetical protein
MTQHRANKDIKHGSGVGATSANGNGPAVLLPPATPAAPIKHYPDCCDAHSTSALGHSRRDWPRATIGPRPLHTESGVKSVYWHLLQWSLRVDGASAHG